MPADVSGPSDAPNQDGSQPVETGINDRGRIGAIGPRDELASGEGRLIEPGPPAGLGAPSDRRGELVSPLAIALDLLRESVLEITKRGNPTTAAAVSLQMRRLSQGKFDPDSYGFPKFRDFLRFAESIGAVKVLNPEGAPDVTVLLAAQREDAEPTTSPKGPAPEVTVRAIRRDFWQSFVDWKASWGKLYDLLADEIVSCRNAAEAEALLRESPSRYYRVTPADQKTQLDWMRSFAEQVSDSGQRDRIKVALAAERPFSEFAAYMRDNPTLKTLWKSRLHQHIVSEITEWLRRNDLAVDIYQVTQNATNARKRDAANSRASATVFAESGRRRSGSVAGGATVGSSQIVASEANVLRNRIIHAVSLMPLHELLRLPVPAEYLLRTE